MRRFNKIEVLRINQIQAVPQINDRSQHGRSFDFAPGSSRLALGPPHRTSAAVFPKVKTAAQPIVFVGAPGLLFLPAHHLAGHGLITTMIAYDQRTRNHQRKLAFNLPLEV